MTRMLIANLDVRRVNGHGNRNTLRFGEFAWPAQFVHTNIYIFFGPEFEFVSEFAMSVLLGGRLNTYCTHTHTRQVCRCGCGRNCWEGLMRFISRTPHPHEIGTVFICRKRLYVFGIYRKFGTVGCWPLRGAIRGI